MAADRLLSSTFADGYTKVDKPPASLGVFNYQYCSWLWWSLQLLGASSLSTLQIRFSNLGVQVFFIKISQFLVCVFYFVVFWDIYDVVIICIILCFGHVRSTIIQNLHISLIIQNSPLIKPLGFWSKRAIKITHEQFKNLETSSHKIRIVFFVI